MTVVMSLLGHLLLGTLRAGRQLRRSEGHLPGVDELRLSPQALAQIMAGTITAWEPGPAHSTTKTHTCSRLFSPSPPWASWRFSTPRSARRG